MNKLKQILKNYHPNKYLLLAYLLLPILSFSLNTSLGLDNDRWFLLNTGRYILNNGIPHIEPFTLHTGFSYVAQQWLFSIILYFIYHKFDNLGLIFLAFTFMLITEFIFYKLCNFINNNRKSLSTILTLAFTILYILNYNTTRPQLFDFIVFLIEFYILEKYIKDGNKKRLLFLPILSIFLINYHASVYFMLYAFMLPYILNIKSKHFEYQKYDIKPIIFVAIISLIVSIINPYLFDAHKYLFNSYGDKLINKTVGEMITPFTNIKSISTITILITIALPNLIVIFKKKDMKLRYFLLYIGTVYLTISSYKGYQYYLLGAIFPLSDYLKEKFLITKEVVLSKLTKLLCIIIYIMIIVLSLIVFSNNFQKQKYDNIYPIVSLVDKLDNIVLDKNLNKSRLKVYTDYNIGGYVEWMGYKAYIDPRAEVFLKKNNHKDDIFKEYHNLQFTNTSLQDFINKYHFDFILVNKNDRIYKEYLNNNDNHNYKYVMKDIKNEDTYFLYERDT